ncbi:MAG: hypothetical protein U9Q92_03820 [archaeon]|nr:hypothetical protein [archaeon]
MRNLSPLVFVFFVLGALPLAFADNYDLALHITMSENFTLFESNSYKVIVKNNGTVDERINISLLRTISSNQTIIYQKSGNYSLKKSVTKTYQWTPQESGNYTICANITSSTINDTHPYNDGECRDMCVINISVDENSTDVNESERLTNFTCDLDVKVSARKFFFDSKEGLGIKVAVEDINHSGIEHSFSLAYWIEDLFGNVVKGRHEKNYTINLSETRSYNPHAPTITDSEAYVIKAEITDPGCNDTSMENNYNETMILVKGIAGEEADDESRIEITKVNPKKTTFGDIIDVSVDAYRGDTLKYSLGVWVERMDDGFDVSEKSTVHLKNKNTEYSLKIPVVIKSNCNEKYKNGKYELIAEGLGVRESTMITLSGLSSSLCKTETVTKYRYKVKEPEKNEKIDENNTESAVKVPGVEFRFVSWEDNISVGDVFLTVVEVRNNKNSALNVSVYSYVMSNSSWVSEGLSAHGVWEKSWMGNKKELLIDAEDFASVNLTNRVMKNVSGNYTLKVKMNGDIEKVLERMITVKSPAAEGETFSVFCNASDKKTYLFLRNDADEDVSATVSSYGRPQSRREVAVEAGERKQTAYFGMVDRFVVEYDGSVIECVVEHDSGVENNYRELESRAPAASRNESIVERLIERIYSFFKRR